MKTKFFENIMENKSEEQLLGNIANNLLEADKYYEFEKTLTKDFKEVTGNVPFMELFHNVTVFNYGSHDHTCIAYLHEIDDTTYAMDIQTGIDYELANLIVPILNGSEEENKRKELDAFYKNASYLNNTPFLAIDYGTINYDLFYKIKYSYDDIAKQAITYNMNNLEEMKFDIKNFVVVTNGLQNLEKNHVQSHLCGTKKVR